MKKRLWVLHPLLLASTLPALAAQSDEDSIIVSANRTHRTVAEMAQTTWVIEGQEIEQQVQGGKEFKDVLAQLIPGIDVSSQGRTNYGMNMRGRAIVVLIDGVRLNSSRTDSRQLDAIDPFNIEHVEVISGATSLYGGGSTGGLINIVTKKGQQDRQVDLEVGSKSGFANSNDHDERVAAAVSGGTDHASGRLSVAYQRFGGWYDGNNDALILDNTQTGLQHSRSTTTASCSWSPSTIKARAMMTMACGSGKICPRSPAAAKRTPPMGSIPIVSPAPSAI